MKTVLPVQNRRPPLCCSRSPHTVPSPTEDHNTAGQKKTMYTHTYKHTHVYVRRKQEVTYMAQLMDLMLFLGFDVFPEDVDQQRTLTQVFMELLRDRTRTRAGANTVSPSAVSAKRQCMGSGSVGQKGQGPD